MLQQLKSQTNQTTTTNGDLGYLSTLDEVLDLFGKGGNMRDDIEGFIILLDKAYGKDPELALKTLFYLRDVRGGQGERDVFRAGFKHVANLLGTKMSHLIPLVSEYGRYDDLFVLFDTRLESEMLAYVKRQLTQDTKDLSKDGTISLLGKWMPSINASSKKTRRLAERFAKAFDMSFSDYRKMLVALRTRIKLVETTLSNGDISTIDYGHIPSKAHHQYKKAFWRRDGERYEAFIDSVENGELTVNAGTLYPYDLVSRILDGDLESNEERTIDALWNNLPDFTQGNQDDSLVVVDVSYSMNGSGANAPINVAIGLGLYIAERNKGLFHNHFLTFHTEPKLVQISGSTVANKIRNMKAAEWGGTTDLEKTFDLILKAAVTDKLPSSQMVKRLIIVSDMQFNQISSSRYRKSAGEESVIASAKKAFEDAGYTFPELIFWNVAGDNSVPITKNTSGVALLSGSSPSVLKAVLGAKDLSPLHLMLEVLESERYAPVHL